jgi:4-hydroxy-2-oxoheptanedioate aldolase
MRENKVKRALREGAVTVGSWVTMEGTLGAELMANAGFDWLLIDMEHGPLSMTAAQSSIAAIRTTETVPLVRPAWNESALIQTALDIGAYGLIVPMVNTRAEAEQVVRDTRYPPLGERSRGGVRSRLAFKTDATTYGLRANDEILLLLQIETAEALANAGEMLALDGVDGIFLGPNDMASSLGCWPPVWVDQPPALAEAIARIPAIADEYGKVAGILTPNATVANHCIALGYEFVGVASDVAFLEAAALRELASVSRTGDTAG